MISQPSGFWTLLEHRSEEIRSLAGIRENVATFALFMTRIAAEVGRDAGFKRIDLVNCLGSVGWNSNIYHLATYGLRRWVLEGHFVVIAYRPYRSEACSSAVKLKVTNHRVLGAPYILYLQVGVRKVLSL